MSTYYKDKKTFNRLKDILLSISKNHQNNNFILNAFANSEDDINVHMKAVEVGNKAMDSYKPQSSKWSGFAKKRLRSSLTEKICDAGVLVKSLF